LNAGYEGTAEIFSGGYTRNVNGQSLFDGMLEAHGEDLVTYLAERGFTIRRA
jgi:hypothetical protein